MKGVLEHTFFDGSGVVLFKVQTGETIALAMSLQNLFDNQTEPEAIKAINMLLMQGFIIT